ncbi:MAG: pyrroline-5-carboxylate reductase [Gemmatimonadetes bacterium]|nr:pyrroline-5-carboxylate reductase [Gemmatimonadota bacterium]
MLKDLKLAVLGTGRIGETLISGLLESGVVLPGNVTATAGHAERVEDVRARLGIGGTLSNVMAAEAADIVLLSVKPRTVPVVLAEIAGVLQPHQLLISVAASVSTSFIEALIPAAVPVVRAMPNTPCLLKKGMTAISAGRHATHEHMDLATFIFDAVGRTVVVDEKHMDAVTGLSASGPAYIYVVIESLAEAGVKVGLPRDLATQLAAQTVVGAGSMVLETRQHPAQLKDAVTTPAGCTIDGLLELEAGGLRVTLINAVVMATRRAGELVDS